MRFDYQAHEDSERLARKFLGRVWSALFSADKHPPAGASPAPFAAAILERLVQRGEVPSLLSKEDMGDQLLHAPAGGKEELATYRGDY
jgi:hypothetical protein